MPQLHLRRFADDDGRIVGVARDRSRRIEGHVSTVAVEKLFYTVETPDGPSGEVEELLSQIEGEAESVIRSILSGTFPPPQPEKERLATFIAFQWLRGSDMRETFGIVMNDVLKLFSVNMTRKQIREAAEAVEGRPATDEEVERLAKFVSDPSKYNFEPHRNESIRTMLDLAPGLANLAANRSWQLIRFETDCLLTSDAPVSLWSPPDERRGLNARSGFGMSREVRFPLDRRHALVLSWKAKEGEIVRTLPLAQAAAVNFWTATNGHRWIYHHPSDDPLNGLVLPPPGPKVTSDGPIRRIVPDGE